MDEPFNTKEYMERMQQFWFSEPKECYKYARSTYEKYANTEQKDMCAVSLYFMAKCKRFYSDMNQAESYILKALRIAEETEIRIHMLLEYTAILLTGKNYQLAFDCLYSAYEESFNIASSKNILVRIFNTFGVMYGNVDDPEKAILNFNKCLRYLSEQDVNHFAVVHINIAECYVKLDEFDFAKKHMDKATSILKANEVNIALSYYHDLYVDMLYKQGLYDEALDYIQECLPLIKEDDSTHYINIALTEARIHYHKKQYDKGENYYTKALDLATQKSFYDLQHKALKGLIDLCEETGDDVKLLRYLKLFYEYSEKEKNINELHIKESMRSADEKFETRKKLLRLQQQNDMLHRMNTGVKQIHELCKSLLKQNQMSSVFSELHHNILSLNHADIFGIALLEEDKEHIVINSFNMEVQTSVTATVKFDENDNLVSRVIKNKQHLYINDLDQYDDTYRILDSRDGTDIQKSRIKSSIYIPLQDDHEVFGVMTMQSYKENAYSQQDIDLLEILASFASLAIRNLIRSRQLKIQARMDPLTELYNRRALQNYLNEYDAERVSIIFTDIDFFKQYNDSYGHLKGDECIQKVAKILKESIHEEDMAARYGGDEFIILLKDTKPDYMVKVVNTIRKKIEDAKIEHNASPVHPYISLSIGAANKGRVHSSCLDEILHMADEALYEAKSKGRNSLAFRIDV